jgi:hypothetical protein
MTNAMPLSVSYASGVPDPSNTWDSSSTESMGVAGYDCVHAVLPFVPEREAEHSRRCRPDPDCLSLFAPHVAIRADTTTCSAVGTARG